jgi:hypothetical protein
MASWFQEISLSLASTESKISPRPASHSHLVYQLSQPPKARKEQHIPQWPPQHLLTWSHASNQLPFATYLSRLNSWSGSSSVYCLEISISVWNTQGPPLSFLETAIFGMNQMAAPTVEPHIFRLPSSISIKSLELKGWNDVAHSSTRIELQPVIVYIPSGSELMVNLLPSTSIRAWILWLSLEYVTGLEKSLRNEPKVKALGLRLHFFSRGSRSFGFSSHEYPFDLKSSCFRRTTFHTRWIGKYSGSRFRVSNSRIGR